MAICDCSVLQGGPCCLPDGLVTNWLRLAAHCIAGSALLQLAQSALPPPAVASTLVEWHVPTGLGHLRPYCLCKIRMLLLKHRWYALPSLRSSILAAPLYPAADAVLHSIFAWALC